MSQFKVFATVKSAHQLLAELAASPQLIVHVKLVGEAAELLIAELDRLAIHLDKDFIRLGVAFHDAVDILPMLALSHRKRFDLLSSGDSYSRFTENYLQFLITHRL